MNEPANFCGFPCNDPKQLAKNRGLPPNPPPTRDPPREIPGFPSSHDKSIWDNVLAHLPSQEHEQEPLTPPVSDGNEEDVIYVEVDHDGDDLLRPPYRIDNHVSSHELSDKTVYTDLQHANGQWTYDSHNLYGMRMYSPFFLSQSSRGHDVNDRIIYIQSWAWQRGRPYLAAVPMRGHSSSPAVLLLGLDDLSGNG